MKFRFGFRYRDGKVWVHKTRDNPGRGIPEDRPAWSVDIREIMAMFFVGAGALCLILKGQIHEGMYLLVGLLGYATGRTVPVMQEKEKEK